MINENFYRLKRAYLFDQIDREIASCKAKKIINLSVGDATKPISPYIVSKMQIALNALKYKRTFKGYPPITGYDFFKEKIATYYNQLGVKLSNSEVFISDGAKTDLFSVLSCFSKQKVLIHNPTYPAYLDQSIIYGNQTYFINANKNNNFLPIPDNIDKSLKGSQMVIYICSPDNPTGAVYTFDGLQKWVNYALTYGSVIVFDSAYSSYIRGNYPKSIYQIKGAEYCAVEISSLSKSVNFTGVRCGYTIVPCKIKIDNQNLNQVFNRIKCAIFNGVSYLSQVGGTYAFTKKGQKFIQKNTQYYLDNAMAFKRFFDKIGVYCLGGENSPYCFFKCPTGEKSFDFFKRLLNKTGIVTTPGVGFNTLGEGYIRITGFGSKKSTSEAISLLSAFFKENV